MTLPSQTNQPAAPKASANDQGLSRAVRAVSGVTLLSRFGGLVRDIVLVRTFGDTAVGSAFAAAFAIPNMFRRLFGEGALSAAFVPEYTRAVWGRGDHATAPQGHERGGGGGVADGTIEATDLPIDAATAEARIPDARDAGDRARREASGFASLVIAALGLVTGGLTVLIELALAGVLLLGAPDAELRLSIGLVMVMLPFMPLVCVTAIEAAMLQVHGRFGASMTGPLVLNGFIIVVGGYCWLSGRGGGAGVAYLLGAATVLSGLTQMVYFARLLRPHARWTTDWGAARPRARRMLGKFVPVMVGLGTLQINAFIDTLIAMWPVWVGPTVLGNAYPLDERSNAILSFTQRLYQFPLGVFGLAVATAAFPMLSRHADDPVRFVETIRRGVRLSLFIGLPASVGLMLVRADATAVLFGDGGGGAAGTDGVGGFSAQGLERSAAVLLGFSAGIWAYALNHLLTRVFYARGDTRTPMRVSVAMVLLNIALNCTLIWPLREAGLAWSTSVCAMVQFVVLAVFVQRMMAGARRGSGGGHRGVVAPVIADRAVCLAAGKVAAASAVMGGVVWVVSTALGDRQSWIGHAIGLAVCMAAGGLAFGGVCWILGVQEGQWLLTTRQGRAGAVMKSGGAE